MGLRQLGAPGEAQGLTPRAHSSALHPVWTCRSLSAALPYWRRHDGPGPAATSDRYGRFSGRRPPLPGSRVGARQRPVLGPVPLSLSPLLTRTAVPQNRGRTRQVDCKGMDGGRRNRPMGARHAINTPRGPHTVRSASSSSRRDAESFEARRVRERCKHSAHER